MLLIQGRKLGLYVLILLVSFSTQAHESIDKQIRQLSDDIATSPDDYRLYLRRADQYRHHQDWNKALLDYGQVEKLDPGNYNSVLGRAQLELDRDRPKRAIEIVTKLLKQRPEIAQAHFVYARALMNINKTQQAAQAYTRGIALLNTANPDHYLDRARALAASPNSIEASISSIDDGLTALPNNISLEKFAADLEISNRRYDQAIQRINRILSVNGQQPFWLVRKAEVLTYQNRMVDSEKTYQAAWTAISRLPLRRQNTAAMGVLKERIFHGSIKTKK